MTYILSVFRGIKVANDALDMIAQQGGTPANWSLVANETLVANRPAEGPIATMLAPGSGVAIFPLGSFTSLGFIVTNLVSAIFSGRVRNVSQGLQQTLGEYGASVFEAAAYDTAVQRGYVLLLVQVPDYQTTATVKALEEAQAVDARVLPETVEYPAAMPV